MNATSTTFRFNSTGVAARVVSIARGAFAFVGLLAILVLSMPAPRELLIQRASEASQDAAPSRQGTIASGPIYPASEEHELKDEQRAVAGFIARRYRVSDQAVSRFVAEAYRAGHAFRVDPLLILAVAAIESRYNPVAESFLGAKGLMQIIPKYHQDKLRGHGGDSALLDPVVNIHVGAQILREYLKRFGETEAALQMYGGAFDEPTSQYANKVLSERSRLEQTVQRLRQQS
jgi:soluble lytic murein transglycosylase-like protein